MRLNLCLLAPLHFILRLINRFDMQHSSHIAVKKKSASDLHLHKFIQALFPKEEIELIQLPQLKEIDTYVLFHTCAYGEEEIQSLKEGIKKAHHLLEHELNSQANVVMIFFRDLNVSFPERKLRREKFMSELISEDLLNHEGALHERMSVIHEFGTQNLQDTLQQLTGKHLYFEVL